MRSVRGRPCSSARFLILATVVVWLPPLWALGADVSQTLAVGSTASEHPLGQLACVPGLPFMIPTVSLKYHPSQRVGFQVETGYASSESEAKNSEKSKSDEGGKNSILVLGGKVLVNAVHGPHHNLYLGAGPSYFNGKQEDSGDKQTFSLVGIQGGAGVEVFPPYAPQVGISMEIAARYLTGSMKSKPVSTSSSSSSTSSPEYDISQFGLRNGAFTLGVHYYFGKPSSKRRNETGKAD